MVCDKTFGTAPSRWTYGHVASGACGRDLGIRSNDAQAVHLEGTAEGRKKAI